MRGFTNTRTPNESVQSTWVGKRVNRNGTEEYGTVLRAYWQGPGQPVKLTVDWDQQTLSTSVLTDSEHCTLVKEGRAED